MTALTESQLTKLKAGTRYRLIVCTSIYVVADRLQFSKSRTSCRALVKNTSWLGGRRSGFRKSSFLYIRWRIRDDRVLLALTVQTIRKASCFYVGLLRRSKKLVNLTEELAEKRTPNYVFPCLRRKVNSAGFGGYSDSLTSLL